MNTRKASLLKRFGVGLASLTSVLLAEGRVNAETIPEDGTIRTRVEQTENTETDSRLTKTTFGFAPDAGAGCGQENLRIYNYDSSSDGGDYTSIGVLSPTLKLGNTNTTIRAFGNFGDKEGIGTELKVTSGNSTFYGNLEKATEPKEARRIGVGLDQQIGKTTARLGFDNLSKNGLETNYFTGGAFSDITRTDQIGLGIRIADSEKVDTNSALAYWCHFGKDEKWGTRTRINIDDSSNGTRNTCFETIISQSPTFSRFSSPWMISRNVDDGGMYNPSVVENPLTTERTPLGDRTLGGLAFQVSGNYLDNGNGDNGSIKAETGYKVNLSKRNSITPSICARRDFGSNDNSFGAGVLARFGNFTLEFTGDDDKNFYGSLTYGCSFGGK